MIKHVSSLTQVNRILVRSVIYTCQSNREKQRGSQNNRHKTHFKKEKKQNKRKKEKYIKQ